MRKNEKYLTMAQKRELALKGERVPICVGNSNHKSSFIAKIRGAIFDDSLKNKRINL